LAFVCCLVDQFDVLSNGHVDPPACLIQIKVEKKISLALLG
jgi:hypothetical protein